MESNRIIQLDGLRFFAVLMVMVAHWSQWHFTNPILVKFPFVNSVAFFFVLSGFLITRILLENRDLSSNNSLLKTKLIKNFFARRFLRIFPIYYLLLIGLFVINYKNTRELFPWLVSYSSNIFQSIHNEYVGDFGHFWSLAVEEQFYIFWPFLILFVKPNRTLIIIICAIVLAFISRIYLFVFVGKWMATAYFTLSCMYSLGLGALLAYLLLYHKKLYNYLTKKGVLFIGCLLYAMSLLIQNYFGLQWYKEILDVFLFSVLSTLIIAIASQNGYKAIIKFILENKLVSFSGKISYGLYVYHLFIPTLYSVIAPYLGISIQNSIGLFVAYFALTFLLSYLSWIVIESPINKLKTHFPYLKKD